MEKEKRGTFSLFKERENNFTKIIGESDRGNVREREREKWGSQRVELTEKLDIIRFGLNWEQFHSNHIMEREREIKRK